MSETSQARVIAPSAKDDPSAALERIDTLPTIPVVVSRIGELVADPRSNADKLSEVLKSDQSLSAKVLKLANSAYYGIPGGVADVRRAVSFLGFNTLHQLALSVSVLSALSGKDSDVLKLRQLWQHALGCAALAEIIARRIGAPEPGSFFTAGLLHDIGKVALIEVMPQQFLRAVEVARASGILVGEAERAIGIPTHAAAGTRLAERWRFPMALRAAIRHAEHGDPAVRAALPRQVLPYADVVALANTMVRRFSFGDPGDNVTPELDPQLLDHLNLSALALEQLRDELLRTVERSKVLLELAAGP